MSHTAETRKNEYAKMLSRRELWLRENGPCRSCGAWERLEVDHINPADKVHHAVWTWSDVRRNAELAKCQPLCHECHRAKTAAENRERFLGVSRPDQRKLTPDVCAEIDRLKLPSASVRRVAEIIGLHHTTVSRYLRGVALADQSPIGNAVPMRDRRRFPSTPEVRA